MVMSAYHTLVVRTVTIDSVPDELDWVERHDLSKKSNVVPVLPASMCGRAGKEIPRNQKTKEVRRIPIGMIARPVVNPTQISV
jgi:hypothetical protein